MRFYIATSLENWQQHNLVRDILIKEFNWTITYDWTIHGSVQNEGQKRITEVAYLEKCGVVNADVVIVLLPGGRGTHVELGMALVSCDNVYILADHVHGFFAHDERTCAFYHDKRVHRIDSTVDDLVKKLRILNKSKIRRTFPV